MVDVSAFPLFVRAVVSNYDVSTVSLPYSDAVYGLESSVLMGQSVAPWRQICFETTYRQDCQSFKRPRPSAGTQCNDRKDECWYGADLGPHSQRKGRDEELRDPRHGRL